MVTQMIECHHFNVISLYLNRCLFFKVTHLINIDGNDCEMTYKQIVDSARVVILELTGEVKGVKKIYNSL